MPIPQDPRSPWTQSRHLEFENVGSDTIPPRGGVEVVDVYRPEKNTTQTPSGGREVWKVRKPTTDSPCLWAVNGPCAIPPGEFGKPGTEDFPMIALMIGAVSPQTRAYLKKGSYAFYPGGCMAIVEGDYDAPTSTAFINKRETCETQRLLVRAVDCHRLGLSGSGQPQKYESGQWVDDTSVSPVTVADPLCYRMALEGEKYWVENKGTNECGKDTTTHPYQPTAPYGLSRRVLVYECIACRATGPVRFLKTDNGTGSGSGSGENTDDDCDNVETLCETSVKNTWNRALGCIGREYIEITATPGSCCWRVSSAPPIPAYMIATLTAPLCSTSDTNIDQETVQFLGACENPDEKWTRPTKVSNPMNRQGCSGNSVLAAPHFTDCTCKWIVVAVQPTMADVMTDVKIDCKSTTCTLDRYRYTQVALESCDATVCTNQPVVDSRSTGDLVEFLATVECTVGSGGSCSTASVVTKKGCMFCVTTVGTTSPLSATEITYVDGFHTDQAAATGSGDVSCPSVSGTRKKICVVTCGSTPSDAGNTDPFISGEEVAVLTEISCGDCITPHAKAVCVLSAAAASEPQVADGCKCSEDCPPASGSGSG